MRRDLFGHMKNWLFGIALLSSVACSSPISIATPTPFPSPPPTPTATATATPPISTLTPLSNPTSTIEDFGKLQPIKKFDCPTNCWQLFQELNNQYWENANMTVAATYNGELVSPGGLPDSISLFYRLGQHRVNYNPFERKMTNFSTREEFQQFIVEQARRIRGMLPEIAIEPIFDDTSGLPIGYYKWQKYRWSDAGYSIEDKIIREEVIAWNYRR